MAAEVSYKCVMEVTTCWDKLKQTQGFRENAGAIIFNRVFELEPQARRLFKFSSDEDVQSNPPFRVHAAIMVDMIDMAVRFLGPDLDPLQEGLIELGKRHVRYGVPPEYLPVMERAVTYMLDELLVSTTTTDDGGMSRSERHSWQVVSHFMIRHMTAGMKS